MKDAEIAKKSRCARGNTVRVTTMEESVYESVSEVIETATG